MQVNSTVYLFGGALLKDGSVSNELFWMTSERMEWHAQPTHGDRPCGRHGHVAIYDPDHHQLVVFGGRCAASLQLFHWRIDLCDSGSRIAAACVCTRCSHATACARAQQRRAPACATPSIAHHHARAPAAHMLQQCRNADRKRLADVAVLDLDSFTWRRPATSGPAPSPREGAAAAYHAGHMVLFGERPGAAAARTRVPCAARAGCKASRTICRLAASLSAAAGTRGD